MKIAAPTINTLLQNADIEGLIEAGTPMDEYTSEAEMISEALQELNGQNFSQHNIITTIALIWSQNFNLDDHELNQRMPLIHSLAKEIFKIQS